MIKMPLQQIMERIKEVEKVLKRPKFNGLLIKSGITIDEIIQKIISLSNITLGKKLKIKICRDPKDNKFLECAKSTGADI